MRRLTAALPTVVFVCQNRKTSVRHNHPPTNTMKKPRQYNAAVAKEASAKGDGFMDKAVLSIGSLAKNGGGSGGGDGDGEGGVGDGLGGGGLGGKDGGGFGGEGGGRGGGRKGGI